MATLQGNDSSSGCGATSIILELAVNAKGRNRTLSKNAKYCNRWISEARAGKQSVYSPTICGAQYHEKRRKMFLTMVRSEPGGTNTATAIEHARERSFKRCLVLARCVDSE